MRLSSMFILAASLPILGICATPTPAMLQTKETSPFPSIHAHRVAKRERLYLKRVFHQTEAASFHGYSVAGKLVRLPHDTIKDMQKHTRVVHSPARIKTGQKEFHTQIVVGRGEVMRAARAYATSGKSVIALNTAHQRQPGDGVLCGKETEEASIFRVSDLFLSLWLHKNPTIKAQFKGGHYQVPTFGGIYSPHVLVFRENQEANFLYLPKPVEMAVVSSSPYNMCHHSKEHSSPGSRGKYVSGTKRKIRAILRIAAHNGHDTVVLSDYGCLSQHNHPTIVSHLFRDVLLEKEFNGVFQIVHFAIPTGDTTQVFLDFSRELNGLVQRR